MQWQSMLQGHIKAYQALTGKSSMRAKISACALALLSSITAGAKWAIPRLIFQGSAVDAAADAYGVVV